MTAAEPSRVDDDAGHPDEGDSTVVAARGGARRPPDDGGEGALSSETAPASLARPVTPPARAARAPARTEATSARTLFRVPFASAMSDDDAQGLNDALYMTLHLHPKHPAIRPPLGVTPLSFGGLFLVRDEGEDQWALECRAWSDPAPEAVRACWFDAVLAARRLDPSVPLPAPRDGVGRAARGRRGRSATSRELW